LEEGGGDYYLVGIYLYSLPGFIMKANIYAVHMLPTNTSLAAKETGWVAFPMQKYA